MSNDFYDAITGYARAQESNHDPLRQAFAFGLTNR
jgi:hypothetical protein